ncbi:MAG: ArsB/NhaD family transporter [Rhodospirillales bacterium]|nr:ArsB/NhaD family transporter [Rhodospirillales bacterium]
MEEALVFDTPMMVSAVILVVTFAGIFTEGVHHIHRTKIAMLGAASMVLFGQFFGFYNPEAAIEAIDWNVVFLLGAMMTIVAIMIPTGGFQAIAYWIAAFSKGRLFLLLVLMGTAVTVISLLLDNVTTVVIFGPLIVLICQALKVNPIPYLLAAALLSDTGGVATLVGDPPNLMIGSAADIDFNTFFLRMGGIVFAAWVVTLLGLKFLFRKNLAVTPDKPVFDSADMITDKKTWFASLAVLGIMVVLFIAHGALHWEAWVVACLGLTVLLALTYKVNPDKYLTEVELSLLMFFVSLFVVIGGVEGSHFLEWIGQFITPLVQHDMLTACLILMWMAAILSAMIDNIPFTAAMIPIIIGMDAQGIPVTPLWWALAIGVGMGGNGTHLGSTANVFIVTLTERLAQQENKPSLRITPGLWFRKGTPVMLLTLVVCSIAMWLFFPFFAHPLPTAEMHNAKMHERAMNAAAHEAPHHM